MSKKPAKKPANKTLTGGAIDRIASGVNGGFDKWDGYSPGRKRLLKRGAALMIAAGSVLGLEAAGVTDFTPVGPDRDQNKTAQVYRLEQTEFGYRSSPDTENTGVNTMQVLANNAVWETLKPKDQETLSNTGHVEVRVKYDLDNENGGGTEDKTFDITRIPVARFEEIRVIDAGSENPSIQFMGSDEYQELVPGHEDRGQGSTFVGVTYGREVPGSVAFSVAGSKKSGFVELVTEPTTEMYVFSAPVAPHGSISGDGSKYSPAPDPGSSIRTTG